MADKKISEFTVVSDLETTDHLTGVDNSAAADDKNVIITVANFVANVLNLGNAASKDVGTTAGTVAAGNDTRLSDARTPTAHAASHATGGADQLTPAAIGAEAAGAAAAVQGNLETHADNSAIHAPVPSVMPLAEAQTGTATTQRTISADVLKAAAEAHSGGAAYSDASPQPLGTTADSGTAEEASRSDHVHARPKLDDLAAPDDNTDLNATTSAHGLLPKLGGGTTNFLRADGSWSAPPTEGGGTELSEAQVTNNADTTFGLVSGQRLSQAVIANSRELVVTERTYYVNGATGNDSNDGLSSGAAFATVQHGVDVITKTLDLGADVTLSIANGTYNENVVVSNTVGAKSLVLKSASNSYTGVTIDGGTATTAYSALRVEGGKVVAQDITLSAARAINGFSTLSNITLLGTVRLIATFRCISASNGCTVTIDTTSTLRLESNACSSTLFANSLSNINTWSGSLIVSGTGTTSSIFQAQENAAIVFGNSTVSGSLTALRIATVATNGVVKTKFAEISGAGAAVIETGGQYVTG